MEGNQPTKMEPISEDIEKELESDASAKKGFRLRGKMFHLTYGKKGISCHVDKVQFKDWLMSKVGGEKNVLNLKIAHENGDKYCPHLHMHVVFKLKEGLNDQSKDCARFFDITVDGIEVHPNIKPCGSYFKTAWRYPDKEDKNALTIGTVEEKLNITEIMANCESAKDALSLCTKFNEVNGALAAYNVLGNNHSRTVKRPHYKWMNQIEYVFEKERNRRWVHWFFTGPGGMGKTWCAQYFAKKDPKNNLYIDMFGGQRDFATVAKNRMDAGWSGNTLICDLARNAERHSIYAPIESFTNGMATATKYNGNIIEFEENEEFPRRCWVFANFLPDLVGKMSPDRFRIMTLKGKDPESAVLLRLNTWMLMKKQIENYETAILEGRYNQMQPYVHVQIKGFLRDFMENLKEVGYVERDLSAYIPANYIDFSVIDPETAIDDNQEFGIWEEPIKDEPQKGEFAEVRLQSPSVYKTVETNPFDLGRHDPNHKIDWDFAMEMRNAINDI